MRHLLIALTALLLLAGRLTAQDSGTVVRPRGAPQSPALIRIGDSVDVLVLSASADTGMRAVCLTVVDRRPTEIEIVRAVPQRAVTSCPGVNGLLAFVRDTAVTRANLDLLNEVIMERFKHLLLVCGGRREGPGWAVVPECRVRAGRPSRVDQ